MRTYIPKYLDKEVYKRVLSVARSYEDNKRRIKSIEYDKIHSSPDFTVHSSGISKPVQSISEQIEKHTALLQKRVDAVDRALAVFPNHEQRFIMQNVCGKTPMIYCDTLNCERTGQTIRHDFLIALASELGEIL